MPAGYEQDINRIPEEYQKNTRRISKEYQKDRGRISGEHNDDIRRISGMSTRRIPYCQQGMNRMRAEYEKSTRRV